VVRLIVKYSFSIPKEACFDQSGPLPDIEGDMYPTLPGLAGASLGNSKQLDGLIVWPAIAEGKPSPRDEVVYDIEPFRAAVRPGDWKLVRRVVLPSRVELFNLAEDPSEKTKVADKNPRKISELQRRVQALAREATPPLMLKEVFGVARHQLMGSVALPGEEKALELEP
jgi:arylsulfatase A-like enzyme